MLIETWKDIRTLGALRQACTEAEEALRVTTAGTQDSECVYVENGEFASLNLSLVQRRLTDGSYVYDILVKGVP